MVEESANPLFQFLRAAFRAVGEAHRTNPRRQVSAPARLCWSEGAKRVTARARLADISRAGAALITAVAPPLNARARLRLMGREPTPWIEAQVLGVEPHAPARHRVRLKFSEPCPTYFLRVAVLGPVEHDDSIEPSAQPAPEPDDVTLGSSASA